MASEEEIPLEDSTKSNNQAENGDDDFKDAEDEVVRIAKQAHEAYSQQENQWDLYFYRVVLAGNVKITKQVVAYMSNNNGNGSDMVKTLDWLLQRDKSGRTEFKKNSTHLRLKRVLMFMISCLVNVILTPLYYGLQLFTASFVKRRQRHISDHVRLPLAFAAFSMESEMLELFLSLGVDMDQSDANGNNVFHYIADLSCVAPESASEMFETTMDVFRNVHGSREDVTARTLLQETRNSAGLTAVEYAATFGSPSLLTLILTQPNIMHHTPFEASQEQVTFNDASTSPSSPYYSSSDRNGKSPIPPAKTRTEILDVTMYEAGTMDQATLLNVLSDRDVAGMSIEDLHIFNDREFIGKWLQHKSKQRQGGIIWVHLLELVITFMLVYILSHSLMGQYGVANQKWMLLEDIKVQEAELNALSRNTSSILTDAAVQDLLAWKRLQQQQRWWNKTWSNNPDKVQRFIDTLQRPDTKVIGWNLTFDNFTSAQMDTLYEATKIAPDFANDTGHLHTIRLYPAIVQALSKKLVSKEIRFFHHLETIFTDKKKVAEVYESLTLNDVDAEIRPSLSLPHVDLDLPEVLCANLHRLTHEDFRDLVSEYSTLTLNDLGELISDACYYQLFMNVAAKGGSCQADDHRKLFQMMFGERKDLVYLPIVVVVCMYVYVALDIFERCVYVTKFIQKQTDALDMIMTIIIHKIPGSYIRKQLNILACVVIISQFHFQQYVHSVQHARGFTTEERLHYDGYAATLLIIAIIVRFIMHIHSLRLLPSIGNFVITMFMMGTNLLHFSAVFGIIVLIFAMLFYILIDNPTCPLENAPGFLTYLGSVFSTFRLTYGHGDLTPFFSNVPVQIAYVLYVIIVVLLLLNLIIAIMSTTATGIMAQPWRKVLWKMEWLDEVTSLDFTLTVLSLPWRSLRRRDHRRYASHQHAGFLVRRLSKYEYRVYVECFRYPAMREAYAATERS